MAYSKRAWKDRIVQYARRFTMQSNGGNDKQLLPPMNEGWFLHENTRMKIANFVGKVGGSTVANPNEYSAAASSTFLDPYSASWSSTASSQSRIDRITALDGTTDNFGSTVINGARDLQKFSFNLIEEVIRKCGVGVFGGATTTAERVAWIKANMTKVVCNWYGNGSSPTGNKATLVCWAGSFWYTGGNVTHANATVTKLAYGTTASNDIQPDGIIHFLVHSEPSNGTIASTVNTDYVELEMYMKTGSVPQADYELTLNATANFQASYYDYPVVPNTTYTFSAVRVNGGHIAVATFTADNVQLSSLGYSAVDSFTKTTEANAAYLRVHLANPTTLGTFIFRNPQLEVGSVKTPFAPMPRWTINQSPGIVTDGGTPVNAANLNWFEDGLEAAAAVADSALAAVTTYVHPLNYDPNLLTTNGKYDVQSNVNMPPNVGRVYIEVTAYPNKTYVSQTALDFFGNRIWTRRMLNLVWSPWVLVSNDVVELTNAYDLNLLIVSGSYYVSNALSAPIASTNLYVDVAVHPTNNLYIKQTAYMFSENRVWTRRRNNGTWSAWAQVSNEVITYANNTNINSFVTNGTHYVYDGANAPVAGIGLYYEVRTHPTTPNLVTQTAYLVDSNKVWTRRVAGGSWTPWSQLSNETILVLPNSNVDAIVLTGMYNGNNLVNKPAGSSDWGYIDVINYTQSTGYIKQTYYDFYTGAMWNRVFSAGVWQPWMEVYTTATKPYASGTYTGNGAATRDIALPFTPSAVIVMIKHGATVSGGGISYGGLAVTGNPVVTGSTTVLNVGANKMTVYVSGNASSNENNAVYHYIAYK